VVFIDGSKKHLLGVLVGDVLDHQRCPPLTSVANLLDVKHKVGCVALLLLGLALRREMRALADERGSLPFHLPQEVRRKRKKQHLID